MTHKQHPNDQPGDRWMAPDYSKSKGEPASNDQPLAPTAIPDDETRGEPTVKNGEVPDGEIKQFDYRDSPYFAVSPASPAPQSGTPQQVGGLTEQEQHDQFWSNIKLAPVSAEELARFPAATQAYWKWKEATFKTDEKLPLAKIAWDAGVAYGEAGVASLEHSIVCHQNEVAALRARLALQESALKDLRTQLDQVLTGDQEGNIPWHNERYGKLLLTLLATETLVAKMRAELIKAFEYLGREIQTLSLNDSAALGVQAMHRTIAEVLDLTPSSIRDALKDAQGEIDEVHRYITQVWEATFAGRINDRDFELVRSRFHALMEYLKPGNIVVNKRGPLGIYEMSEIDTLHADLTAARKEIAAAKNRDEINFSQIRVMAKELTTLRTQHLAAKKDGERLREALEKLRPSTLRYLSLSGEHGSSAAYAETEQTRMIDAALASPHKREEGKSP